MRAAGERLGVAMGAGGAVGGAGALDDVDVEDVVGMRGLWDVLGG